ncbi:hypothetical protein H1R20_g9315, partial [Candolleomyces eurysporus]
MLEHLRHLLHRQINWTHPGQQMAVNALLELQQDVLVILRTGIGKSIIGILPTLVENYITLIVIPLVVLMEDWKTRLTDMGLSFEEYDATNPHSVTGKHNIVLVSPDKAAFDTWPEVLASIDKVAPVVRVVIDEAHLWFTDNDFRSQALGNPSSLRLFPMQMVILSATIPPVAEQWMTQEFALVNPVVIRGLSHRAELKMVFMTGYESTDDMADAFEDYIGRFKEEHGWGEKDRFVIYANYHNVAQEIADKFELEVYQASTATKRIKAEERRAIYNRFKSGEREGLVATTALSAGTDYPHIRLTCHIGTPFDLVTFVQQASRAGRDGQPAHCLVITSSKRSSSSKSHNPKLRGVREMSEMVFGSSDPSNNTSKCARWHIGRFLDGEGYTCRAFGPEWQTCSPCEDEMKQRPSLGFTGKALARVNPPYSYPSLLPPPMLTPDAVKNRLAERFQKAVDIGRQAAAEAIARKAVETDPYGSVLGKVGRLCGLCLMRNVAEEHDPRDCSNITNRRMFGDIVYNIVYKPRGYKYPPCYKCHIASMGNNTLHGTYTTGDERPTCKHPNFIKPLLYEVWNNEQVRVEVQRHFKVQWKDMSEYISWLAQPDSVHSTRSMGLVVWFGQKYLPTPG